MNYWSSERKKEKNTSKRLDQDLKIIGDFFVEKLADARIYIFGSFLTKDFNRESDIDILVVSAQSPPFFNNVQDFFLN